MAAVPQSTQKKERRKEKGLPWSKKDCKLLCSILGAAPDPELVEWTDVARQMEGRNAKQCREKWKNDLRPNLQKGHWSPQEEYMLVLMHSRFGNRWSEIARFLPRRSENSIKNNWNATNRSSAAGKRRSLMWVYGDLVAQQLHASGEETLKHALAKYRSLAGHIPLAHLQVPDNHFQLEYIKMLANRDAAPSSSGSGGSGDERAEGSGDGDGSSSSGGGGGDGGAAAAARRGRGGDVPSSGPSSGLRVGVGARQRAGRVHGTDLRGGGSQPPAWAAPSRGTRGTGSRHPAPGRKRKHSLSSEEEAEEEEEGVSESEPGDEEQQEGEQEEEEERRGAAAALPASPSPLMQLSGSTPWSDSPQPGCAGFGQGAGAPPPARNFWVRWGIQRQRERMEALLSMAQEQAQAGAPRVGQEEAAQVVHLPP